MTFTKSENRYGATRGVRAQTSGELASMQFKGNVSDNFTDSIIEKFKNNHPDIFEANKNMVTNLIKQYVRSYSRRKAVNNWTGSISVKYGEKLTQTSDPVTESTDKIISMILKQIDLESRASNVVSNLNKLNAFNHTRAPISQASLNNNKTSKTLVRENINVSSGIRGKRRVKAGIIKNNLCI
jgi:hypothetical protein